MMSSITFHLGSFDGPLDLLLHLISKNKVSIYDIPIVVILDQYMEYINSLEALDLNIVSEFVSMAANLIYIKSRMLLPKHDEDEEDPRTNLVEMLLEYRRFKSVSSMFEVCNTSGRDILTKPPEIFGKSAVIEYDNSLDDLVRATLDIFARTKEKLPPPVNSFSGIVGYEKIPISSRIRHILEMFVSRDVILYHEFFNNSASKGEAIATFLAILELCRANRIIIIDDDGDIKFEIYLNSLDNLELSYDDN